MFGRSKKLPASLTPALESDERVLAWARVDGLDAVVVATNRGLWLPDATARLGWHEIHKATWGDSVLTVVGSSSVESADFSIVSDLPAVSLRLVDPGTLPRRVQERVTASVAVSTLHRLPDRGSVRVVARRVSGRDGLTWSVRFEDGASRRGSGCRRRGVGVRGRGEGRDRADRLTSDFGSTPRMV